MTVLRAEEEALAIEQIVEKIDNGENLDKLYDEYSFKNGNRKLSKEDFYKFVDFIKNRESVKNAGN